LSIPSHGTLVYATVFTYFDRAFTAKNVNRYRRSPLKQVFEAAAARVRAEVYNPAYTMIGNNIEILRNSFTASKAAGKTWQIWAGATSTCTHTYISLIHLIIAGVLLLLLLFFLHF
jgi:hypothetical protein